MQDIIIVCAGGVGCEVYHIIRAINKLQMERGKEPKYNVLGFLSDVDGVLEGKGIDLPILGKIEDWQPVGKERYALGLSDPSGKEKIVKKLRDRGVVFETLIAPWARMPEKLQMGEGCIIAAYCIGEGTVLGDFVNIMGSMVGAGACVGNYSTITGFANITNSKIGERVFVGSHAVIMNNKKIGDDAFICVGSVVVNNVKAGTKVFGVPAKRVYW